MYIVRFISFDDVKYVLNENSTFCLHEYKYYRNLYEDGVKDEREGEADFSKLHRSHLISGLGVLVSCWTELEDDFIKEKDWNIFPDKKGIAIVSNVDKIQYFLTKDLKWLTDFEVAQYFEKSEVEYYGDSLPTDFDKKRDILKLHFFKRNKYDKQREYRFAFILSSSCRNIQSLIFYVNPSDYIESIYLHPALNEKEKDFIIKGSIEADVLKLIKNYNI